MAETPASPSATPRLVDAAPAAGPEFSARQVFWCSLLGTPIAGAVCVSLNLRARGRPGWQQALPPLAVVLALAAVFVVDAVVSTWALWLAVPLLAFVLRLLPEGNGPDRPVAAAILVAVTVWLALLAAGRVITLAVGRSVPELREVVFDVATGHTGAGVVRFGDGATRQDARHVRDALDRAGYLADGLAVRVSRADELVISVTLQRPIGEAHVAAAREMVANVAARLEPQACVVGRIVAPEDDAELARGRICPQGLDTTAR